MKANNIKTIGTIDLGKTLLLIMIMINVLLLKI